MAGLAKAELFGLVEHAFRLGGWNILYLSPNTRNPARYVISRNGYHCRIKVYIWTITHGGKSRAADEYRIQPTATERFNPEIGGKTLILGWWPGAEVFAGYDLRYHSGKLGKSSSFQIGEAALRHAATFGFALHRRGSGDLAVAFQPEFLGTYAQYLEEIHGSGVAAPEVDVLAKLAVNPKAVGDKEISNKVAKKRQFAFVQTRRALRDLNFAKRVFTAYGQRCAMCGIQLRLIEGAHIVPAADTHSSDETSNGIALCALHHKAYDAGLVTFDEKYRIQLNHRQVKDLRRSGYDEGLAAFRRALRPLIHLPPDRRDQPEKEYVKRANALRGWEL